MLTSDDNLAPDLIANAGPNLTYSDIIKRCIYIPFSLFKISLTIFASFLLQISLCPEVLIMGMHCREV